MIQMLRVMGLVPPQYVFLSRPFLCVPLVPLSYGVSPPVALSMITHCLTRFDCVYLCPDLCTDLCLVLVYKPCVHVVRSQTWLRL